MIVYLSGAMSGIKEYNKEAFDKAQRQLFDIGLIVVNPHDLSKCVFDIFHKQGNEPTRYDFMRVDIRALTGCDAVYMIPGWETSWGAKWERIIAKHVLNMPIYYKIDDIPKT